MNKANIVRFGALALLGLAVASPAWAEEANKAELDAVRQALEKYKDWKVAVRDLYLSTNGCVHYDGSGHKDGHVNYAKGAMGVHFVNLTIRDLDPMKPNVLIYEPNGDKLELVAAEWLVPLTPDTKERPKLFGQEFLGPMEGHEPLIPAGFVHYDLHAWLFKENPRGMFDPVHPDVKCDGYIYPMLEGSTKIMPGP
jgi:hypothetical protein